MSRTIQEVLVYGREFQEVRGEVIRWMKDNKVKLVEERQDFIKGRIGLPGGLGLTAPKYFEISFKFIENGMLVHMEGYIGAFGVSEMDFAPSSFMGGIPRKQGWKAIQDLWRRLRMMSTGMPQTPVSTPTQSVQYPCPKCGRLLSFINQYQKWYCNNCQKYAEELEAQRPSKPVGKPVGKKYCFYCGTEMPSQANFCTNCGKKQLAKGG